MTDLLHVVKALFIYVVAFASALGAMVLYHVVSGTPIPVYEEVAPSARVTGLIILLAFIWGDLKKEQ